MLGFWPHDHGSSPTGRRTPSDWKHVESYGFAALGLETVETVERRLGLPFWHWTHDQGKEGSCVGHGSAMERAITNIAQQRATGVRPYNRRYDPIWLWNQAKLQDEWPDTNPGDDNGTSVRAAYDVLRALGLRRVSTMQLINEIPTPIKPGPVLPAEGVSANRWATTVDEMRTAIAGGTPVTIGVNWYSNFDKPTGIIGNYWIGKGDLGAIRGGHCLCVYGASDKRQAFRLKNSWGRSYPLVWMPYTAMQRLLKEDGEAALSTDR